MKKFAVGCLSVCIAAFCIAIVAFAVFGAIGKVQLYQSKVQLYQSYPRTQGRVIKVKTWAVHLGADPMEYESSVQLEYTVDGKSVRAWYDFGTETSLSEGDTVSVAYNPDNPSDCMVMGGGPDPVTLLAFGVAVVFIACMFWTTFRRT